MVLSLVVNVSYGIGGLGWLGKVVNWSIKILDKDNEVCIFALQGDKVACAGQKKSHTINRAKFDEVNWSVSDGGSITSISGVGIEEILIDYKTKLGIPLNFPVTLKTFYANNDKFEFSYTGQLSNDITIGTKAGANVTLSYNGQTVTVDNAGLTAGFDLTTNTNYKDKLNFALKDVFKGDKGAQIDVTFDGTRPDVEVTYRIIDAGFLDFCNDGGNTKKVKVNPRPSKPVIYGLPNRVVTCNEQFGLSTNSQGSDIQLAWTIDDAITYGWQLQEVDIDTYRGTSVQIGGFKRIGSKPVFVAATNICGDVEYTNATIDVQERPSSISINNKLTATKTIAPIFSPTCAEAQHQGIGMNVSPYINGATYTWYIPRTWYPSTNTSNYNSVLTNANPDFFVYSGVNLNYFQIRSLEKFVTTIPSGEVRLRVQTPCGGDETIKFYINGAETLNLSLIDNFSCNSNFQIKPVITGGTAPFVINWKNDNSTGVVTPTVTRDINASVAYKQNTGNYNTAKIIANITDARGCKSTDEGVFNIFGGFGNTSISGWASGRLDYARDLKVTSNLVSDQSGSKFYFTALDEANVSKIYVYKFDNAINVKKWVAKEIVTKRYKPKTNNNTLALVQETAGPLLLFTDNQSSIGALRLDINDVSNQDTENQYNIRADVFQVAQNKGASGNFVASNLTLMFKDIISGYLKYQQFVLQNGKLELSGTAQTIANTTTQYDFDQFNFKVFYFLDDFTGDLYCKDLKNISAPATTIKLASNDMTTAIYEATEIEFDRAGNMYVFQQGDLYILKYNALTETYGKLEKLAVSKATGINIDAATGSFTINPSTGTIYYTGYDKNLYQIFKENAAGTSWKIIKSTRPGTGQYSDFAGTNKLLHQSPHLFYVSSDNQLVYNLFYVQGNNTDCVPSNLRLDANTEGVDLSNAPSISTETLVELDFSKASIYAYPNPMQNSVTIFADGKGEANLEVYTVLGEKVLEQPFDFNGTTLNVENLAKGTYIARVTQNNTSIHQVKLVK